MSSSASDPGFLPEHELPGDARLYIPANSAGERPFEPLPSTALRVRRDRNRTVLVGGVVMLVGVIVAGLAIWLLRPSRAVRASTENSPSSAAVSAAESRLLGLLPAGYMVDSCNPRAPTEGALAQVNCAQNSDPGGPLSATYALMRDTRTLDTAFDKLVATYDVVICPGRVQSPGPWRRSATPELVSGTLFCGRQNGRDTVAWTNEAELLLSVVQDSAEGTNLTRLYAWWSSHS